MGQQRNSRPGFADQPTARLPVPQPARQKQRQSRSKRGRGTKAIIWLMSLALIAILLVVGFRIASDTVVKPIIADRVEEDVSAGVQSFITQEINALPDVADVPQEIIVSEVELNQRIAQQPDLGPLNDATTEITTDGIEVRMSAYGLSGTYRANVGIVDGMAVIRDGSLSGPLGYVIPVEDLEQLANDAIARSLISSEIQVTEVTLVDGEMILTLESTGARYEIPTG